MIPQLSLVLINYSITKPRSENISLDHYSFRSQVETVHWTFDNVLDNQLLSDFLSKKHFDLVINLPMLNGGARRVSNFMTHGYRTRRLAVDYSVPLVTDVKCAKLLVEV